jgi:hypothetical protein
VMSNGSESKRFTSLTTISATPCISPACSPPVSPPQGTPNSPHDVANKLTPAPALGKALSDYVCRHIPEREALSEGSLKCRADGASPWTYARHLENTNALRSPPGRH